jgi:hypothetical protein
MTKPDASSTPDPSPATIEPWRDAALRYLSEQLGPHAPDRLGDADIFSEEVLEGEGAVAVFRFTAAPGGYSNVEHGPSEFFVVVGRTEPNYYPAWSLSPDELFSVHLGTRFMLTVGVSQISEAEHAALDPREAVAELLKQVAPGAVVEDATVAAMFAVGAERHAVCRCRIASTIDTPVVREEVYVMAADGPPGFYRRAELPPHVVYRLHLGNLMRQDAAMERRGGRQ